MAFFTSAWADKYNYLRGPSGRKVARGERELFPQSGEVIEALGVAAPWLSSREGERRQGYVAVWHAQEVPREDKDVCFSLSNWKVASTYVTAQTSTMKTSVMTLVQER